MRIADISLSIGGLIDQRQTSLFPYRKDSILDPLCNYLTKLRFLLQARIEFWIPTTNLTQLSE